MGQTHHRLSCALFALLVTLPFASAQLQLTGIVHGPISGAPKAVELFATADIEDLSIYGLGTANNGTGSAGEEWSFPAIPLPANSYIYVSKEQPTFTSFFGFPPDFVDDGAACNFNGDDAVELFANGIAVDRYGDPNLDGTGEDWEYTLGWAFRDCADDGGLLFNPAYWSAVPGAMSGINANAESDFPWPLGEFALPCAPVIEGCTEPHADNYNPWATADDGSCDHTDFFAAAGCTYALAPNFDPDALLDDGSCQGFAAPSLCPEDLNANGAVDVGDLLALLGAFGETCGWQLPFSGNGMYVSATGVPIHYCIPADAQQTANVVLVFHGNARNAADYRDDWVGLAQTHGLVVLAPEFSSADFPGSLGYMQGGMVDADGDELPVMEWTFSLVDPIIEEFQALFDSADPVVDLWGHSAGAQFVHRFMMFLGSNHVDRAVAANAGWYTTLDPTIPFPYGMMNAPEGGTTIADALAQQLVISLGTADTSAAGPLHTTEADAQGLNRYARGLHFMEVAEANAPEGAAWTLVEVPGVGHDPGAMGSAAAVLLFGD
jgi:poly(3-hydroxybutyrate) depolymerase